MAESYNCFLAVPARLDVSPLVNLLRAQAVEFKFETLSLFGNRPEEIKRLIRSVDFVLAVIDSDENSGHVLIELGIALGIGRPVFAILTPTSHLPPNLLGVTTVQADLHCDVDAIDFHLRLFLKEALRRKPRRVSRNLHEAFAPKKRGGEAPKEDEDETITKLVNSLTREDQLENAVLYFLQEQGLHVEEGVKSDEFRPDLALWLREPSSPIGNQILIEIKKGQRSRTQEDKIAEQLRRYLDVVGAKAALLLWQSGKEEETPRISSGFPLVFSLSVPAFIKLVEAGKLVPTLIRERNRHVHGLE